MREREAVGELELQASAAALRALADQEARLKDLRTQTATLLAAASVCISLVGPNAIAGGGSWGPWVSVGAFVLTLLAALYVLLPDRNVVFALHGVKVYRRLCGFRDDPDEIHLQLAYWMGEFWDRNQPVIDRKARGCNLALASLAIQALVLAAELVDRLYM